jgi:hypothetical protein
MRIISFIDQPGVIKKFFNTLVYGEITFDPSYS